MTMTWSRVVTVGAAAVLALSAVALASSSQSLPDRSYWLYVAAESDDQVSLVRFGPGGAEVAETIDVGVRQTEIEGPHGLRVSPDGDFWYVSVAHGNPFGAVYKFRTGTNGFVASAEVGMFPATMDVSSDTGLLYVANFDLHGAMVPGTISVVETESMIEVLRVEVGIMPHGSRLGASGERHYAVMMMSDELVETDALGFDVTRRLRLADPPSGVNPGRMPQALGRPTWVEPSPDGRFVYVAMNGTDQVLEIDVERWEVTRAFRTAPGPYNIAVSPDGQWMVASYRTDGSTGVWDLPSGEELATLPNSRDLPHGVVISPDSRYAFVSVEGVGGEPGSVDVIDLEALELTASVDIGKQGSGISFWKMEDGANSNQLPALPN